MLEDGSLLEEGSVLHTALITILGVVPGADILAEEGLH